MFFLNIKNRIKQNFATKVEKVYVVVSAYQLALSLLKRIKARNKATTAPATIMPNSIPAKSDKHRTEFVTLAKRSYKRVVCIQKQVSACSV